MVIKFTIEGDPVAQGRPKASRMGGGIRMYDPPKSVKAKKRIAKIAKGTMLANKWKPLSGPIVAQIKFFHSLPKHMERKTREKQPRVEWYTGKVDIDNETKLILDGLNGIAFKDDSQVVNLHAMKFRCGQGDKPRTEIILGRAPEETR